MLIFPIVNAENVMSKRMKFISPLCFLLALVVLLAAPQSAKAQSDDLNIYGYFQTQYTYSKDQNNGETGGYSSFKVPQLNILFSKNFGSNFTAFVSTEFLNNFDSSEEWGTFRLGEAWVRYDHSNALKVKGGMLIPKFNNLNEIKNRTPLLPYAFRPLVYEQSFTLFGNADYVPQRAYLQVYGSLPMGGAQFDYAAYVGNSESRYLAGVGDFNEAGTDTTFAKMFGGRVGIRYNSLKIGVSGTIDDTNMRNLDFFGNTMPIGVGDVTRYRLGADLSFDVRDFFVESEVISVIHNMSDEQDVQWTGLTDQSPVAPFLGEDLDQLFYYGMVGYNITDKLSIHTLYNLISSNRIAIFDKGAVGWGGGLAYRPVFPVLLKANYTRTWINGDMEYTGNLVMVAASISF